MLWRSRLPQRNLPGADHYHYHYDDSHYHHYDDSHYYYDRSTDNNYNYYYRSTDDYYEYYYNATASSMRDNHLRTWKCVLPSTHRRWHYYTYLCTARVLVLRGLDLPPWFGVLLRRLMLRPW